MYRLSHVGLDMAVRQEEDEGMKLTTTIAAWPEEPQALLHMMQVFNTACNWLSVIAFQERLFHWLPLQRRAYHELRLRFGLTSAQATVAVRKVAYSYSDRARRDTLATFRPLGAIPLFKHTYRDRQVRLYGQEMPVLTRPGVVLPRKPKEGILVYRDGRFFIHQVVDVPEPAPYEPLSFLGADLGIVNILVDSAGEVYSGGHLNGLRHRHARLRARLQAKGTKSATRLLRKRRHREDRFARWVNHGISKQVVAKAKTRTWGIALEDLDGIRGRTRVRRAQRRQHHAWAFDQLQRFVIYKAALAEVPVILVDPRNTSRTCPACGLVDKRNRPSQATFLCIGCGFVGLADAVAAGIIARRAAGDQPDAAVSLGAASCKSL